MRPVRLLSLLLVLGVFAAPPAVAQGVSGDTPLRPATRVFSLTNARVVVEPGRVLDRATVLVRDGRIEAVGTRIEVPFDAEIIEADSFTVYAGFIDALSVAGIAEPESPDRYEGDPGDAPRERAGITPDRDVRALFNPSDARVKALRDAGFTLAHVVPRDGLWSGQGALLSLRTAGRYESLGSLVVRGPISTVARIDGASGVYPATPMGVLAVMRQSIENARRRQARGADREAFDPVLDALDPLVRGDRGFVFVVGGWLDGFRALRASSEMGLRPILAGVPDVAPLLDRLRDRDTPVVTSLALPDTVKADSMALAVRPPPSATPGGVSFVSDRRTVSYRDLDAERSTQTGIRRVSVQRAEASPSVLAAARVPFAFGTFDVKPADIRNNLRRMIAAGLSPDDALAALTTAPAAMLGVEALVGTVEPGRLANLVVTTGDYFADSTQIRMVIVDGVRFEIDAAAKPSSSPAIAAGTWTFSVETPGETRTGSFTLTGEPGSLSGTLTEGGATRPLTGVVLDGATLTFTYTNPEVGDVLVAGTLSGDEFEGTATVASFGSFPFTATRQPEAR